MVREVLFDFGKMITARQEYNFGIRHLSENGPKRIVPAHVCFNNEIAEIILKMRPVVSNVSLGSRNVCTGPILKHAAKQTVRFISNN